MENHDTYLVKMKDYQLNNNDMFLKYENLITNIKKTKTKRKKAILYFCFLFIKSLLTK